jgi:hypothetical protein
MSLNLKANFETSMLVASLKSNKDEHVKEYKEAMLQYDNQRKDLVTKLKEECDKFILNPSESTTAIQSAYAKMFSLTKPVNAEKQYDQYIRMLSTTTSQFVELDVDDANAILSDDWSWAKAARITNSVYSATAASKLF